MDTYDRETTRASDDSDLVSPSFRQLLLDAEVAAMLRQGFHVQTRFNHHAVLVGPGSGRVEVFIDEFGSTCRS
jgi:hypothetical protein